jgi:hypothetical protein
MEITKNFNTVCKKGDNGMKNLSKIKKWQLLSWKGAQECADLREESFLSVGKHAFRGKKRLEEVILPEGMTAIKTEAFYKCRRLKRVVLPPDGSVGISQGAFRNCHRLQELEGWERVTQIGARAFEEGVLLREPKIGGLLRRVGDRAFYGCLSLRALTVPASVSSLGKEAFAACTELESVTLEEGLTVLSPRLFEGCLSLRSIEFPYSVQTLPQGVLQNCSALEELALHGEIKTVERNALRGCSRLERVTMDLGVTSIGAGAFRDTPRLQEVAVPHSLKKLGWGAFGLGTSKDKITLYVDNEYMLRRMRAKLFWCGSAGRVRVVLQGMTLEERKKARRRKDLNEAPVHLEHYEEP